MSFWLFLSLLPIAAVGGMVAAKITVGGGAAFGSWLAGMAPSTRQLVTKELGQVAEWKGGAVGPIGAMVFLWLASSGIHGLFEGFDAMTARPRSWARTRGISLGACVLLSVAGGAVAVLSGGVAWVRSVAYEPSASVAEVVGVLYRAIGTGVLGFVTVAGLYALGIPRRKRHALPIFPGALFATVLQAALTIAYTLVIRETGDGSAYLAGLATVGVAMTFLYLNVLSILLGVAANQWWRIARRLERMRRGRVARQVASRAAAYMARWVSLPGVGSMAAREAATSAPLTPWPGKRGA